MSKTYSFQESNDVAKEASNHIEEYLNKKKNVLAVVNVEEDKAFQEQDIDLVLLKYENNSFITKTIEIKADRYYKTGNYFFETKSNAEKGTAGCFLYSNADLLFYYFIDERELHIMNFYECRKCFLDNISKFTKKDCQNKYYHSEGRLVPRVFLENKIKITKIKI